MKLKTQLIYKIDEHPDKEAYYEWIRSNWHDLGEFTVQDALESLKGFSNYYDLNLDYSISIFPDPGEHITAKVTNKDIAELSGIRLFKYLVNNYSHLVSLSLTFECGSCPFTGMVYDEVLLDEIRAFLKKPDSRSFQELIDDCTGKLMTTLNNEGEYIYSDEGLKDLCQANEYEFTIDGQIV